MYDGHIAPAVLLLAGAPDPPAGCENIGTIDYLGKAVATISTVLMAARAISSSVVDSSPFSTSGSLVVANSPEDQRDHVFRRLIQWGFSMVAIAPLTTWRVLVAPGRL